MPKRKKVEEIENTIMASIPENNNGVVATAVVNYDLLREKFKFNVERLEDDRWCLICKMDQVEIQMWFSQTQVAEILGTVYRLAKL